MYVFVTGGDISTVAVLFAALVKSYPFVFMSYSFYFIFLLNKQVTRMISC